MLLRYRWLTLFLGIALASLAQSENDSTKHQVYFYENGQKSSEGTLRQGKPDGFWRSYYRNGQLKSKGNRRNFELDSTWTFYNREGQKTLEIDYQNGLKDGERRTYENGKLVKVEPFEKDKLQGFVKHFDELGKLQKEIPYEDNQQEGTGYEYDASGRIITLLSYKKGKYIRKQQINRHDEQRQKQGVWMEFHSNREIAVEGLYRNDLKNGYWKYYKSSGDLIRVEKWVNGELQEGAEEVSKVHIKRKLNPKTGKLAFKGAYRNGIPTGVHREYDDEGNVQSSTIYDNGVVLFEGIVDESGLKQGPWKQFYRDGTLKAEGRYKDDLKVGEWRYFYRDSSLEQVGSYLRGLPDGEWSWFHPNGETWREEEFELGKEDGSSIEYSDSGTVIAKGDYIDGERDGFWFFNINDHREEGVYFEGRRNGTWKHYFLTNNQLRFEGDYENGVPNGTHSYYYPNGQLKRRGNFRNGMRDGIWEMFTDDGERILTIEYDEGEEQRYDGKKIKYGRRYNRATAREEAQKELEEARED